MIDIEARAQRAVEAPVGPPPDRERLAVLAGRIRRRRVAFRATASAALVVAVVGGVALIVPGTDTPLHVTATGPTSASSSLPSSPGATVLAPDLVLGHFVSRLSVAHHIVSDGTVPGTPLAPRAHLYCVDGTQVRVYEYRDRASRIAVSDTISADGSRVGNATVDWVGPPHFFAKGRIIVLVLSNDVQLEGWLWRELGPTLSPQAHAGNSSAVCSPHPGTSA